MKRQLITHFVGLCWLICFKGTQHFSSAADPCAFSSVCPAYASCHNDASSYHCACKPGFAPSFGEQHFTDRTVRCNDIDECTQDPALCGPNASCKNTVGRFVCKCLTGYSSPSGASEQRGVARLNCTDIDECLQLASCPAKATCTNTPGSHFCTCNPGFASSSGEQRFTDPAVQCDDINECSRDPSPCGPSSICSNTLGSYTCTCPLGYLARSQPGLPFSCTDVDECAQNPAICGPDASCINTPGSYTCQCSPGYRPSTPGPWVPGTTRCTDVDECAQNPAICGPDASCINTPGSYTCQCSPGYRPSTPGRWVPGTTRCTDVDECAQNPAICGPDASCINTPGNYTCQCSPGHFPSTPGPWVPGTTRCTADACAVSSLCPAYSTCENIAGSYHCTCKPGFASSSGEQHFTDRTVRCNDIDECTQDPALCGPNTSCRNTVGRFVCKCLTGYSSPSGASEQRGVARLNCTDVDECAPDSAICGPSASCINTPGSYTCQCSPGHRPSTPGPWVPGTNRCTDVDECAQNPAICGPDASCINTPGSYTCQCSPGHLPSTPGPWVPGTTRCTGVASKDSVTKCQNSRLEAAHGLSPGDAAFCMLLNSTFSVLGDSYERKNSTVSLEKATVGFASILEQTPSWSNLSTEQISTMGTVFLQSVESVVLAAFANPTGNKSQTIQMKQLDVQAKVIEDDCAGRDSVVSLEVKGETMKISCRTIQGTVAQAQAGVAFASYVGMESILNGSFFHDQRATSVRMNSRVVSAFLTSQNKTDLPEPVNYTFQNILPSNRSDKLICVSWEATTRRGSWSPAGCEVTRYNATHTTCRCRRVSNLAVLMASGEITADFPLFLVSHIGLALSLLCLFLAILTFLLCRAIRNVNTSIHLQLCLCLFLADLLFLTAVDSPSHQLACAVIAGLLHYLFLACFAWMFLEAVVLFLTVRNLGVVNYFSTHSPKMWHLSLFGYGFPALVVAVSAAVMPEGYGRQENCWLSVQKGFIWSFLGPVCIIIGINSILFALTLWMLQRKLSSLNTEVSTLKDTRLLTFKAIAQVCILGCTWIFGLFQIGPAAMVMAYLFTIVNSLQGVFIFLVHCLLNRQVREEYKRWFTCKPKSYVSDVSMSTLATSSKAG